jgi:hypothetical protein
MYPRPILTPIFTALLALCSVSVGAAEDPPPANKFSFSDRANQDQTDAADQAAMVQQLVPAPCQQRLKDRRILLLIAERTPDQWLTNQDRFEPMLRVIEKRLKALGLKTYTQQQIKAEVAQAEVDAYFKNDPDAALAASKRLGANFILRGSISSQTGLNPVVGVNEVAVNVDLTLGAANGRVLSDVTRHSESYSGSDTLRTALALIQEQADTLVAQLYNDYCLKATGR